jgi:hypothetical protein
MDFHAFYACGQVFLGARKAHRGCRIFYKNEAKSFDKSSTIFLVLRAFFSWLFTQNKP